MKTKNILNRISQTFIATVLLSTVSLRAGQYGQDFLNIPLGATNNFGDGSTLFSTHPGTGAFIADGTLKELQLTENAVANTRSAFLLPALDSAPIYAFSAKWNGAIYGNFAGNAADGFSFNYGPLVTNLLGSEYSQETGYSNGISFCVQTFAGNNPGFHLRVNGKVVASVPYNPLTQWGNFNPARHYFEMDWHYADGVTVRLNGQTIFNNVPTYGFIPGGSDRFVLAARTGGFTEELRFDNITVQTGGNLRRVPAGAPYFYTASDLGWQYAFDGIVSANGGAAWFNYTPGYAVVGATLPSARNIRAFSLSSGSQPSIAPKSFALYAGNGSLSTLCGSVNETHFFGTAETRCWPANSPSPFTSYGLAMSGQDGAGSISLSELSFYEFVPVTNTNDWTAVLDLFGNGRRVAMSADGSVMYTDAGFSTPRVSRSLAFGEGIWTSTSIHQSLSGIACSADGTFIFAANSKIYISDNSGDYSWQSPAPGDAFGYSVACSANGAKVYGAGGSSGILISTNAGQSWTASSAPTSGWGSIDCSADGSRVIAGSPTALYISSNSGGTWTTTTAPAGNWLSVASSADGKQLVAGRSGEGVYVSTDFGATWTKTTLPNAIWTAVAMSADGKRIAAARFSGGVYVSTDGGATWWQTPAPSTNWDDLAMSADGTTVLASSDNAGVWRYVLAPRSATIQINSPVERYEVGAKVHPIVNTFGFDTGWWLAWGTTTNFGNTNYFTIPAQSTLPGSITNFRPDFVIENLQPATTYYYQLFATNRLNSAPAASPFVSFITQSGPPQIQSSTVAGYGIEGIVWNAVIISRGVATTVWYEWGTTPSYGNVTATQIVNYVYQGNDYPVAVEFQQNGLTPNTFYYYRTVASNQFGVTYGPGSIRTLDTNSVFGLTTLDVISVETNGLDANNAAFTQTYAPRFFNNGTDPGALGVGAWLTIFPTFTNEPLRAMTLIDNQVEPRSFEIQGSQDGINFTPIASNAVPPFSSSFQTLAFSNEVAYRVYRLRFPTIETFASSPLVYVSEIELLPYNEIWSSNDVLAVTLPPGATLVQPLGQLHDHILANSFANDMGEHFEVSGVTGNVVVDITPAAGATVLKGFKTHTGYQDPYPGSTASTVTIAGSNDGSNYIPLATLFPHQPYVTDAIDSAQCLTNTRAFTHYRVTFGLPVNGSRLQINELRLFGQTASVGPALSVCRSGNNLLVRWPDVPGFNLESKTDLGQLGWTSVTNTPVLSNGVKTVTIPMSATTGFFQLRK